MKNLSLLIINNNSELNSFYFLYNKHKHLFENNFFIIDRRIDRVHGHNKEFKNQLPIKKEFASLNFKTPHSWMGFLISGEKRAKFIIKNHKINKVYVFSFYDPIIACLKKHKKQLKIILISQHPCYEFLNINRNLKFILKGLIKSILFLLITRSFRKIYYINCMHNVLPRSICENIIRLYPYHNDIFNFGKIYQNIPSRKNLVFVGGDLSPGTEIDYEEFISDSKKFLNKYKIRYFCFHPLDSAQYKSDIKKYNPKAKFYDNFVKFTKENNLENFHVISILSTVGFDLLKEGLSTSFVPQYFPSINKDKNSIVFQKYLKNLKIKNNN